MKSLAAIPLVLLFYFPLFAIPKHDGYLIKVKNAPLGVAQKTLKQMGVSIISEVPQINLLHIDKDPRGLNLSAAETRELTTLLEYVEPNYYVHRLNSFGDSEIRNSFNHKIINSVGGWEVTTGSDVILAVSDTGIWRHPDLIDNLWINEGETGIDAQGKNKSKNKIDDDGNGYVDDHWGWDFVSGRGTNSPNDSMYHGTHVAGIAGAVGGNKFGIAGVSWKVRLMAVKFLDRDGSGTNAGGVKTIIYASDNGAKIINCSWGGTSFSQAVYDAIEYAKSKNVLVVAAAGNSGQNADKYPLFPAANDNDNIISVASVFNIKGDLSGFTNWGPKTVDIGAPGDGIYSTFNPTYSPNYRNYYEQLSGTSMASPHVAGAAALVLSVNPNLNWNEVKSVILVNGLNSPKLKGKMTSESILDVGAAVKAASQLSRNLN